jgi:hypothetical protein
MYEGTGHEEDSWGGRVTDLPGRFQRAAAVPQRCRDLPLAPAPLKDGVWFKITMVYGATNEDGKRGIRILQGSQAAFQFMDELEWCETDDDLIEALQLPGGVLLSPIEITPMPLGTKEIQERFYRQKPMMDVRRGPAKSEEERQTARISYQSSNFIYPVSLMAPPIALQKRIQVTSNCSTIAGTDYTQTLWNKTAFGSKCAAPYECSEAFKTDSTRLLPCTAASPPATFFGAPKLGPELGKMEGWFFEFLQVAAAPCCRMRMPNSEQRIPGCPY